MSVTLTELSVDFFNYWTDTVKPVALKCAPTKTWELMYKVEMCNYTPTEDEISEINQFHDATGLWYIGHLINDVNIAFMRGRRLNLINSLNMISANLAEDNHPYWQNVWEDKIDSEEAKNLLELGKLVKILIGKL